MEYNEFVSWEMSSKDTIDLKRIYLDITGDLSAGVLLSQIIYWFLPSKNGSKPKAKSKKNGKLWIYKNRADWWEECRISEDVFDRVIRLLQKLRLVDFRSGQSACRKTMYISLNFDVLTFYITNLSKSFLVDKVKYDRQGNEYIESWYKPDTAKLVKEKMNILHSMVLMDNPLEEEEKPKKKQQRNNKITTNTKKSSKNNDSSNESTEIESIEKPISVNHPYRSRSIAQIDIGQSPISIMEDDPYPCTVNTDTNIGESPISLYTKSTSKSTSEIITKSASNSYISVVNNLKKTILETFNKTNNTWTEGLEIESIGNNVLTISFEDKFIANAFELRHKKRIIPIAQELYPNLIHDIKIITRE